MSDQIKSEDGTLSPRCMGGPAVFALSGMRLWTKRCKLVAQTGADYVEDYGKWMDRHGLTHESILVEAEEVPIHVLQYNPEDKGFIWTSLKSQEYLGYLKTHPYHIDNAASSAVKGIYMAQKLDQVVWKNLEQVKEKHGFKIMWEIEYGASMCDDTTCISRITDVLRVADMWSINHNEASDLFRIPRENDADIINELMKLPAEFTLYRVGKRGAYAVTPFQAVFCPSIDPFGSSVDPTGCGNNSTGAAMYAWVEGYDPAMVVAMANVSAGYNAAQHGLYPLITSHVMDSAMELAHSYAEKIRNNDTILGGF